jgi:hypothetical protein
MDMKLMPWAPNLRSYAGICLEGLRETTNDLSEDIQLSDEDLNPGPHKCGGTRGIIVVKAVCYMPEGRGFETR